jgi:hypothetical protein
MKHSYEVTCINTSSNGQFAVTGSINEFILWDLDTKTGNKTSIQATPVSISFDPSDKLIVIGTYRNIYIYSIINCVCLASYSIDTGPAFTTFISEEFIVCATGNFVYVFLYKNNMITLTNEMMFTHSDNPTSIAYNSKTNKLTIGYSPNYVDTYDISTFEDRICRCHNGKENDKICVAYSYDGSFGCSGDGCGAVNIASESIGCAMIGQVQRFYAIHSMAIRRDNKIIAIADGTSQVKFMTVKPAKRVDIFVLPINKVDGEAKHVAYGNNGLLLIGTTTGDVYIGYPNIKEDLSEENG